MRASVIGGVIALLLSSATAFAQQPGDQVTIVLAEGARIDGLLVDKLPNGYLIRAGGETRAVPYQDVVSITSTEPTKTVSDVPPRPKTRGLGLIIPGWIMTGVGGGLTALALLTAADLDDCEEDQGLFAEDESCVDEAARAKSNRSLAVVTGVVAVAGLGMAITGHLLRRSSKKRIKEWEDAHGSAPAASSAPSLIVVPGGGLLGYSLRF